MCGHVHVRSYVSPGKDCVCVYQGGITLGLDLSSILVVCQRGLCLYAAVEETVEIPMWHAVITSIYFHSRQRATSLTFI